MSIDNKHPGNEEESDDENNETFKGKPANYLAWMNFNSETKTDAYIGADTKATEEHEFRY